MGVARVFNNKLYPYQELQHHGLTCLVETYRVILNEKNGAAKFQNT